MLLSAACFQEYSKDGCHYIALYPLFLKYFLPWCCFRCSVNTPHDPGDKLSSGLIQLSIVPSCIRPDYNNEKSGLIQKNLAWYSFQNSSPMSTRFWWRITPAWIICSETQTRFISIGYLISFCCVGVARSALVLLTSLRHDAWRQDGTGQPGTVARKFVTHDAMASHCHDAMASHCLGTTSFIVKESIVNQKQSWMCILIIVGLERVETGILFVDMFDDVSFM
jgi:hypothetical protein